MDKGIIIMLFIVAFLSGLIYSQVSMDWVARYTGIGANPDSGNDIVIDPSGYIYVAGYSNGLKSAFLLIKYEPNGKIVWSKRDAGDNFNLAKVRKMKLDENGNIYLAGQAFNSEGGMSYYAVAKYDSNGNRLWMAVYNAQGGYFETAYDLEVDNLGNVYITGKSYGIGTGYDFATIKYDSSGNQVWVQRYSSGGEESDAAYSIGIDSEGNIYVAGESADGCALIKYDSNGNQLWVKNDCPANGYDLAIDANNNVYVVGDGATSKYNSDGNLLWSTPYSNAKLKAIVLSQAGEAYVVGNLVNGSSYDFITIHYDSNGNQLWSKIYPISNYASANAIAVDSNNYVSVSGGFYNINNYDYLTIRYSPVGEQLWVKTYDGPISKKDIAYSLAIDATGNIYVTGESENELTSADCFTIKYEPNGNKKWDSRYNGSIAGFDAATSIDVDNSGNVFVSGLSQHGIAGLSLKCVSIKYDNIGNEQWIYKDAIMNDDYCSSIKLDTEGNLIIGGSGNSANEPKRCFVKKLNTSGKLLWESFTELDPAGDQNCISMVMDESGNIYLGGSKSNYTDYFVAKFNSQGVYLWSAAYDSTSPPSNDNGGKIAVDANQNVYQIGTTTNGMTGDDITTVKYNSEGNLIWAISYDGGYNENDAASDIVIDANSNIFVSGHSYNPSTGYDVVILKYDSQGTLLWSAIYDGPAHSDDIWSTLTIDSSGNIYMLCSSNDPTSGKNVVVVKYDNDGNQIWSKRLNSNAANNDEAVKIILYNEKYIYILANTEDETGQYDWWIICLTMDGNIYWSEFYGAPAHMNDYVYDLKINSNGNLYLVGASTDLESGLDYTTIKYSQLPILLSNKPLIDDSAGSNPNGIIETDEWVNLIGNLTNAGIWTSQNPTGTLTSDDLIIIPDAYAIYPDIPAGSNASCQDCYIVIAPSSIRPFTHWDIAISETVKCSNCQSATYDFQYHIGNSFVDVSPNQLFYPYIETSLHNGIITGCDTTHYCPSAKIKRQQMAKILCLSMEASVPGSCVSSACSNIFIDVPPSNPFCSFIEALYGYGIISGCQSNPLLYCPVLEVKRDTLAKYICLGMLHSQADSCLISNCTGIFNDVGPQNPFCSYIEALYNMGIISGCAANMYCPDAKVARDQLAKIIVNAFQLSM
jgi:uncharacterized delta-60 repeat protein